MENVSRGRLCTESLSTSVYSSVCRMTQDVTQERVLIKSNEYFSEVCSEGGESKGSFRVCLKLLMRRLP